MNSSGERESIELKLSDYPSIDRRALHHLSSRPLDVESLARSEPVSPPSPLIEGVTAYNARLGNDATPLIERWEKGARPVVTGQQAGFAGGPGYTIAKLASAIRLADRINEQGGDAVPLFWIATEDHDFHEVARAHLRVGKIHHSIRSEESRPVRHPVGPMTVPEDLISRFLELMDLPRPGWLDPGISFGDSFGRLLASIAGGRVILVDSLLPGLRRSGERLLYTIGKEQENIRQKIDTVSARLRENGFEPQVSGGADDEITLLYSLDESGERRRYTGGELPGDPGRISTAALTRPLLQDDVLRPAAFIGGPAEVAYYAQLDGVHEMLGVSRPAVLLRAHVLFAPDKELDRAFRHGLEPEELLKDPETVLLAREEKLTTELNRSIDDLEEELRKRIGELEQRIVSADETMRSPFERALKRITHQLEILKRKGGRAVSRRDRERYEAFEQLHETLMPEETVQDRTVNWISYELGYQGSLLDEIIPLALPQQPVFHVRGIGGNRGND